MLLYPRLILDLVVQNTINLIDCLALIEFQKFLSEGFELLFFQFIRLIILSFF